MNSSDNVNKIVFDPGDEGEYNSQNTEVKPVQGTKSSKDFKKVLGQQGKEGKADEELMAKKKKTLSRMFHDELTHDEELVETSTSPINPDKDDQENASQGLPMSLFDLSKGNVETKPAPQARNAPIAQTKAAESPSDLLFKRNAPVQTRAPEKPFQMMRNANDSPVASNAKNTAPAAAPSKDKITTRYTQEQADLSYVNPLIGSSMQSQQVTAADDTKIKKTAPVDTAMVDLVSQLVSQLYTVETEGKTDTVIVLQHPPLFQGAVVVISSFDSAHGQFNVSFQNLSVEAQKVLDLDNNRKALFEKLEEKGYGIQIFQTTTTTENQPILEQKQPPQQGNRENQQQRGGQQQQEGQQDEEQG